LPEAKTKMFTFYSNTRRQKNPAALSLFSPDVEYDNYIGLYLNPTTRGTNGRRE
jgi:hypothetical protein